MPSCMHRSTKIEDIWIEVLLWNSGTFWRNGFSPGITSSSCTYEERQNQNCSISFFFFFLSFFFSSFHQLIHSWGHHHHHFIFVRPNKQKKITKKKFWNESFGRFIFSLPSLETKKKKIKKGMKQRNEMIRIYCLLLWMENTFIELENVKHSWANDWKSGNFQSVNKDQRRWNKAWQKNKKSGNGVDIQFSWML